MNDTHSSAPKILTVCLGNICRSPLAEAAIRLVAEREELECIVDSAGTAAYHVGDPPDPRSIAIAAEHGIDISQYQGRQITAADYTAFTHIFALDEANLQDIRARSPAGTTAAISLLMDMVPGREGQAVDDPYFGDAEGFAATWAEVSEAAETIVTLLKSSD